MGYPEQKREVINGLSYNYLCHTELVTKPGNVYPAHYHNYIEILYGIAGTFEVLLNGKHHKFAPGDMTLINSKEVHQINALSFSGGSYFVLRFEPEVLYNNMFDHYFEYKYILPFTFDNSSHPKVIKGEVIADTFIPSLLFEIQREFNSMEFGYELAIKNHVGRIFLWILRYFHQNDANFMSSSALNEVLMKRLQPSLDYVVDHYEENIKVTDMAVLCNMSTSYFSRSFNEQMNIGFNEYVNYVRIMESEKLLLSSSMNVTEIATSVGFNTTSYFIKLFKTYKNTSPKQFRKELFR